MHEQAPQCRTWRFGPPCPAGREGDGSDWLGSRSADGKRTTMAALLPPPASRIARAKRAAKTCWADITLHRGRTRSRYDRHSGVERLESLANIASADQVRGRSVGRVAKSLHRALDDRLSRQPAL